MANETFRIDSVSIEGFKAFTTPQEFDFEGRNVFLFGPNGFGKTSIVEAIRWCLFGLASRPGEIVKNQFYNRNCIVQIALRATDGIWTMQRRLRASGSESDLTVRDPGGTERNLEEVFPQLSRIGPREGTHVIYAAQQPSNRRPEADITDFSYVVYRYLGLEEIPRLGEVLSELSEAWTVQETEICSDVEKLGDLFSEHISEVDKELNQITASPPWGDTTTPTNEHTREKVDQLIGDAGDLGAPCSKEDLDGLLPQEKVYEVETAIRAFFKEEQTDVSQRFQDLSKRYEEAERTLTDADTANRQIEELSPTAQTLRGELDAALDGSTLADLESSLQQTEEGFEAAQSRMDAVRASLKYLDMVGDGSGEELCPTCDTGFQPGELVAVLQTVSSSGDSETEKLLQRRDAFREQILACKQLSGQVENCEAQIASQQEELATSLKYGETAFGLSSPVTLASLRAYFESVHKSHGELIHLSESKTEALKNWDTRIENLRREVMFHRLRTRKSRLQNLCDVRYADLHDSLRDLSDLRTIADETRTLLNTNLRDRLQEDLPPVGEEMTEAYLRLTGNPTFDSISIRPGEAPTGSLTLELRVSSTRGSGSWSVGQGVLNGQALNAIQLVPYFVFSRYQDSPLLDLLLLDDPTQAFDTSKIKLLLEELSKATSHATLFIATHEEDRFLPVLKDYFSADDVKAYRATGIDENGPLFEDVPIPV